MSHLVGFLTEIPSEFRPEETVMLDTKKIIAAFAIALMATAGTVAPAQAAPSKISRVGDGWCC